MIFLPLLTMFYIVSNGKESQTFGRSRSIGISASVNDNFVLIATHSYPYSLAKSQTNIIFPVFSTLLGSIANLTIAFPANSTDSALAKWSCPESVDFRISESEEKKHILQYMSSSPYVFTKIEFRIYLEKEHVPQYVLFSQVQAKVKP